MALPKKDVEELKSIVDKTVVKFLGFSEPSLETAALNCLSSRYDRRKTTTKLATLLDEKKAARLTERLFELMEERRATQRRKRTAEPAPPPAKRPRPQDAVEEAEREDAAEEAEALLAAAPTVTPAALTALQIRDMMAGAQRMIEERKRALNALRPADASSGALTAPAAAPLRPPVTGMFGIPQAVPGLLQRADADKARKISQLQAQIQSKLSAAALGGVVRAAPPDKPTPLILDAAGRTVDTLGKEVHLAQLVPTLKANIRARKREEFRAQLQDRGGPGGGGDDLAENGFFDTRIAAKAAQRGRRALRFHEPGRFTQLAARLRTKAQLERLQLEISQIARKTGISSATKLALIAPTPESAGGSETPVVEWWDSVILGDPTEPGGTAGLKLSTITNLVEHPTQMRPPTDPLKPVYMPVFLTQRERKKLRRQTRREAWKEEQEKVRLGLEAAPEPKLRISNLMRVLGTEAVAEPSRVEQHVREQMAKRRQAHDAANAARKLTADQRREKKQRRLKEDTSLGVSVAVYRVKELTNASKKFKVETNAKQLFMTGLVVLFRDCNVVVVEGGVKQQAKYKRLMLQRIKWGEDAVKDAEGHDAPNTCRLVWEGTAKSRSFGELKFRACASEVAARELLKRHSVEHYWDLALSGAVLEATAPA